MKNKNKIVSALLAVVISATALSFSASAANYYASEESGNTTIPDYIESIDVSKEGVDIPEEAHNNTYELTPDGNLTLMDDYYEQSESNEISQKQFLTVTTKSGNTFYIVVDRDGNTDNVYLLNLVDEADLMALINDEEVKVETTTEDESDSETNSENDDSETENEEKKSNSGLIMFVVVAAAGGGFAYYWFKVRNNNGKPEAVNVPDDDEEYEIAEDESEEMEEEND